MKQKFLIGECVHIDQDLGNHMSHFDNDIDAIVCGTYSQLCSGKDISSYQLLLLKNGKPYNKSSWYDEHQLTLVNSNIRKGMELTEEYNLRK